MPDMICQACSGFGVYSGSREPEGVANVCWVCGGSGSVPEGQPYASIVPFAGRKEREDIKFVQIYTPRGVFSQSKPISYDRFLKGERPK